MNCAGWRKVVQVDTRTPLRLGKPLPLIPFVFHGASHAMPDVDKLPLKDVIAVNLGHFRLHADYRHGMHFTALPTAWVSGFDKSGRREPRQDCTVITGRRAAGRRLPR